MKEQMAHWSSRDGAGLHRPNPARIYDYALGGFANFAPDRAAFDALVAAHPDARLAPHANRAFLRRVVAFLAAQGIDRFLDVGSGLPTVGNVHEIAQRINPQARVVYVDNDHVAAGYSRDLLAREEAAHVTVVEADLCVPTAILSHQATQQLLANGRPVALLLLAVLPFVPDDDEARRVVRALTAALPVGSYLAISHGTADAMLSETLVQFLHLYEQTTHPLGFRPRAMIEDFFTGFELVPPGLVFVPAWRPDDPHAPFHDQPEQASIVGAVGRKL